MDNRRDINEITVNKGDHIRINNNGYESGIYVYGIEDNQPYYNKQSLFDIIRIDPDGSIYQLNKWECILYLFGMRV